MVTFFLPLPVTLRLLGLRIECLVMFEAASLDAGFPKAVVVAQAVVGVGVDVAGLFRLRTPLKAPCVESAIILVAPSETS